MGSGMSIADADQRFRTRIAQVQDLQQRLTACLLAAPASVELDRLLLEAHDLLDALSADVKEISKDLDDAFDLGGYQLLTADIWQALQTIAAMPFDPDYEQLLHLLPPGWQPVTDQGGHRWYRGMSLDNLVPLLAGGHFDASKTYHGKYFGLGTYFTLDYTVAQTYGDCVFAMPAVTDRVLQVKQVNHDTPAAGPGWVRSNQMDLHLPDITVLGWNAAVQLRDAPNPFQKLAELAREAGFLALEYLESSEGHQLLVLEDLRFDQVTVVYAKKPG